MLNPIKNRLNKFWHDLTWQEMSGSMGDLGTFLPLVVGLVKTANLDLGTTLLFTGVYNIITGFVFDIPMPVQPTKAIAAVALSQSPLSIPEIMAAGIFVSAAVLFLGVTGLIKAAVALMPSSVIRGMQLGLGLQLATKGFQMVVYVDSKSGAIRQCWTAEGLFLGIFSLVFILLTVYPRSLAKQDSSQKQQCIDADADEEISDMYNSRQSVSNSSTTSQTAAVDDERNGMDLDTTASELIKTPLLFRSVAKLGAKAEIACEGPPLSNNKCAQQLSSTATTSDKHHHCSFKFQIPSALLLIITGIVITMVSYSSVFHSLKFGPSTPSVIVPSAEEWKTGILRAGLPQLALTVFNSVVSVCALANQLFPTTPPTSTVKVASSVGAMNLVGCWFGAMPSCHGAGGLAGQVRFGARTGAAPIFLGLMKVTLSLLFGSSLFTLFQNFPTPILGAMLVFAGVELAAVGGGRQGVRGLAVMLFTATVVIGVKNVAIGVCAGLGAAYLLLVRDVAVDLILKKVSGLLLKRENTNNNTGNSTVTAV